MPAYAMTASAADPSPSSPQLVLEVRSRIHDGVQESTLNWDPRHCAVVVIDMWDDHWCRSAAARVTELAPAVNAALDSARQLGILVVHAPSSVAAFYDGTPQRALARAAPHKEPPLPLPPDRRWGTGWCWPDPEKEPELPIDDTDMGCDCETPCTIRAAWSKQMDAIAIVEGDALTDDGQELFNLFEQRDVRHVLVMGVHLNMCVLGRPTGIRQLIAFGRDVVLVRDLTDTMYNPRSSPKVSHFDGTRLVVEHVERHCCPSVLSTSLTGRPQFRFSTDSGGP
jgi:nicotinamidase-related amidase